MRQHQAEIDARNLAVAIVTFERPDVARAYVEDTDLPWPMLLDPDRRLYHAYAMDRAPRRRVWGLASLRAYHRLLGRGRELRRATGDVRQRGGDVLVDPEQIVRLHHVGDGPADRPPIDALLRQVPLAE